MAGKKHHIHLLPHHRQIKVDTGSNLMESLLEQGIFLRSDCGGKGKCGKCRVRILLSEGVSKTIESCNYKVSGDITIDIPHSSLLSSHIISKAPASLPAVFTNRFRNVTAKDTYGIAIDLGTTTIAVYLCNIAYGEVLSSTAVKNPQALYGDDVMSRIGAIGQKNEKLVHMQGLVVRAIEWGIKNLLVPFDIDAAKITKMVVVGNPTMIHILCGVDPKPIGIFPYQPVFYESRSFKSSDVGFAKESFTIETLPQVSGFIGGDIFSAAMAVDFAEQPDGTLLIDLGTNGELLLKGKDRFLATSCATGPAFEGASLSCGMQAIPGAINKVNIINSSNQPRYTFINPTKSSQLRPSGICGSGIVSAVAQFLEKNIITSSGAFSMGSKQYVLVPQNTATGSPAVVINQKDIRSIQLGKAALISGIRFLLKEADLDKPEKIIIAGAFGSFLDKKDMTKIGMIPHTDLSKIEVAGNAAGAGAVMALCDHGYIEKAVRMANKTLVVDLACSQDFQELFIKNLAFPILAY
jgi:uncharacterized 2Fe-2S/4Fe-4S cluster protein (DUF4445 family)